MVKEGDPKFDPTQVVSHMKGDIAYLQKRAIRTYLTRSYKLLSSYTPGAKAAKKNAKAAAMALRRELRMTITRNHGRVYRFSPGVW